MANMWHFCGHDTLNLALVLFFSLIECYRSSLLMCSLNVPWHLLFHSCLKELRRLSSRVQENIQIQSCTLIIHTSLYAEYWLLVFHLSALLLLSPSSFSIYTWPPWFLLWLHVLEFLEGAAVNVPSVHVHITMPIRCSWTCSGPRDSTTLFKEMNLGCRCSLDIRHMHIGP